MIDESRTPERIYHWQNTQLSIARFYGGCKYNGADYVIAYDEDGQPLKRLDRIKETKRTKNEILTQQIPLVAIPPIQQALGAG